MDLLQTALMREGQVNPQAKDARMAASRLFNVQALILKEIGNRAALCAAHRTSGGRGKADGECAQAGSLCTQRTPSPQPSYSKSLLISSTVMSASL